jgi:formyltetrahydrofolate hydrolase
MEDSAVLFIDSHDRKGLVARVSGLLYELGGNILHAGHHRDHELGRFFMRVEDQVEDLVARGRDLERFVLSRAVRWHLDRRILCYGNKTVVFD